MAEMGRYCRAYPASAFKRFEDWDPDLDNLRQPEPGAGAQRTVLKDDDILYLQEDLIVTDGIFRDEHVIFAGGDDAWRTFCEDTLECGIPEEVGAFGIACGDPHDDESG